MTLEKAIALLTNPKEWRKERNPFDVLGPIAELNEAVKMVLKDFNTKEK